MRVKLFAGLRDRAGASEVPVELQAGATVADLIEALAAAVPDIGPLLWTVRVAVNRAFAQQDTIIQPGDEVAVIPPVSGG